MAEVKIIFVCSVVFFLDAHVLNIIKKLLREGVEVHVAASNATWPNQPAGVIYHPIKIERKLSFFSDIRSLIELYFLFTSIRPSFVHSFTPKAGLLSAIAAWIARVDMRVHTFTGQYWANFKGIKRLFSIYIDKIIVYLVTHCLCDSFSQKDFLLLHGIGGANEIKVLGPGSVGGVDLARYSMEKYNEDTIKKIRKKNSIQPECFCILYCGRINRDKGLDILFSAFQKLGREFPNSSFCLLVVGPVEDRLLLSHLKAVKLSRNCEVKWLGYISRVEDFYAVSDVLCLPSRREGFGKVIIEAAAMGLPAIGTDIYGIRDAIQGNITGMLVKPDCSPSFLTALTTIFTDVDLRKYMSKNSSLFARSSFGSEKLSDAHYRFYSDNFSSSANI